MRRGLLVPRLNVVMAAECGHTGRRYGQMYQQHGLHWPGLLRGPRVGIGALALGMAAAFVAGGIVVSLVAGSYVAVPPAAITIGAQNHTLAEDSRREGGITSSSGRTPLTRELFVDDFVPVPAPRSGPALTRELFVDDFVPVPAARTESVVRLPGLNVGD